MRLCVVLITAIVAAVCMLKYSQKEIEEIKKSRILIVKGSSQLADYQTQQKCCFAIEVRDKNKRKGFNLVKMKFETIRSHLASKSIIPQGSSLRPTKQQVRMNHNRKQWNFKRVVCFLTEHRQGEIQNILQKYGIKHISFHPTQQLDQYDLLMKAFNDAKKKAQQFLDEIEYRIKRVQSVQLMNNVQLEPYYQTMTSRIRSGQESSQSNDENRQQQESQRVNEESEPQHVEIEARFLIQSLDEYVEDSSSENQRNETHRQGQSQEQSSQQEL